MAEENRNFEDLGIENELLENAVLLLKNTNHVVFFTGAGISAESGINTFRDPEHGVWVNKIGLALFGTPFGWNWIPGISWSFFKGFLIPIVNAQPNPAHVAITDCLNVLHKKVHIITQNVDNLHQKAEFPQEKIAEVHGTVYRFRCVTNGHPLDVNLEDGVPDSSPICPICQSKARPDATLFTESLPEAAFNNAAHWANKCLEKRGVMIVIGTTGVVYPAAGIVEDFIQAGGSVIEINPQKSTFSDNVTCFLQGPAGIVLPRLIQMVKESTN